MAGTPRPGEPLVHFRWQSEDETRIADTAAGSTHFFAEELRSWYEALGFALDADFVHCVPCRNELQALARKQRRCEALCHVEEPSEAEWLEMAGHCLDLMEDAIFTLENTRRVRELLNHVPDDNCRPRRRRLRALEERGAEVNGT